MTILLCKKCGYARASITHDPNGKDTHPFEPPEPIPMLLWCPCCHERHIDEGEYATKPHHTHACQACGMVWRPALVDTFGVRHLPGFVNT